MAKFKFESGRALSDLVQIYSNLDVRSILVRLMKYYRMRLSRMAGTTRRSFSPKLSKELAMSIIPLSTS